MAAYRVLIADNVHPECDTILRGYGLDVERAVGKTDEELAALVPDFDGMIVRSAVKVGRGLIEKMGRMRVIGRAGAGVDNIDVAAATERGILVMNTPGGNTISAAEHTVAMILAACRRIPAANRSLLADTWDRKTFVGTELLGKTVGILGVGRIGSEVAKRLRSFDVTLIAYDPVLSDEGVRALDIEPVDFDSLLERADIVTLHLPLNAETRGMIGANQLAQMKPSAFLVNCARGGIVDEAALLAALNSGSLAGAAFDVFEQEPPQFPSELIQHPRFVCTPHIAASTEEAQERVALAVARQIGEMFEGREALGLVNAEGLEGALREEFLSYSAVARKLGAVVRGLVGADGLKCRLTVYGDDTGLMLNGLGASFLVGLLEEQGKADGSVVNPVNAALVAAGRDVRVDITGEGAHNSYRFLLQVEVEGADLFKTAAMTFLDTGEPRLVMLDNLWFDIVPNGPMVLVRHQDKPGTLAGIAAVLGDAGINIADLSLGRQVDTPAALTLIRTDTQAPDALREAIARVPNVERVHFLSC